MKRTINRTLQSVAIVISVSAFVADFGLFGPPAAEADEVTITIKTESKKQEDSSTNRPFVGERPAVDVAVLLDTSNSMDGLIDQAKSQLWNIVQEFAKAKRAGKTPLLRVSVFEYGNTNLPATEGYIRQVVQLTDDLDKVSEALFALSTSGGDEYCGEVISEAIKRLDWNGEPNSYKAVFIAGNEPFTQGSVDYKMACRQAIDHGIIVNTIHCGDYQTGINGKWKDGAELAEGKYMNINQDEQVVHIKCPQDKIIIELNAELNKTYLWYGAEEKRKGYAANQAAQDSNAYGSGGLSSRAAAKSSSLYRNVGRDLVDTFEEDNEAVRKLEVEKFPAEMQGLSPEQRMEKIESMSKRRAEIKAKLAAVNRERLAYIAAEKAKAADESAEDTFGDAFSEAVRNQLQTSGFEIEN
ncbi:hypothetical protein Q31b_06640 [Novipirellula aureliae]|uniref:VWFA domain-containing protein n=2 Tax=Novipirellula aureliae TaxID=2527966 RepID=A0A5C6E955_9BACT|nr:hypothetical protein Q31b_06640 [Novipirellula aureliae]